ncbi:hypothetical protein [Sporolactobacillus putidus]|uniref:Uncharacterized protein n=1 Tax=Sporolactobacillus putidus TaxID=492735 RepID=A0A917W3I5_9BACL|nr:hypothetical protein [Sporolactobacillus putidus]GGL58371.1 hypothetical protein GCM10007968_22960 [Sporolactobacillus putidus]
MKKVLLMFLGVLIVISGLLFMFNYNQSLPRVSRHSETASSKSVAKSSTPSSSTTTHAEASSSHSSVSSSSVSTGSNQPTSSRSSADSTSTSTNTISSSSAGTANQAENRPQGAWVKTFEQNLYRGYHVTPSRYVYFGNGLWGVWVKEINTGQYPYVTVNQYTGNFHG